jgi:hypothetical protein
MTAATPAPGGERLPLGEVLVQHGILTPGQLIAALERQRETGRQLGEIIVRLGFASGPMIAQALATQHGGLTKTEYGFATGWSNGGAPAQVAEAAPDEAAELRRWALEAQAAIEARDAEIARLETARADLQAAVVARDNELASALERAAAIEAREAEIARLETARADLQAAAVARDNELASALERAAATEAREAEIARLETALADLQAAAVARDNELAGALERAASAEHARAELEAAQSDRWASAPLHVVLRRGAASYDVEERGGPPPAVGETVDGRRVARVAAPVPGADVPWVYLAD